MTTAGGRFLRFFTLSMLVLSLASALFPRVHKGFAVESLNVGVYWNPECTEKAEFIDWGTLTPGSTKEKHLYLRNEGLAISCFMTFWATDWNPLEARQNLPLHWDYDMRNVPQGETVQVGVEISVSPYIVGITDFGFTLNFAGTPTPFADLDHDGVVSIFDLVILALAFSTTPSSPDWNPEADLNSDDAVNIFDMIIASANYLE